MTSRSSSTATSTAPRSCSGRSTCRPTSPSTRAEVGDYYDGLSPEERRHQVLQWREEHAAERASGERGKGWLGLVDVDEFLVLARHRTIGELMAEQTAPRVRFLNFNVDTAGYDESRPVLEQHSRRWSRADLVGHEDSRWAKRVKSLVRYRRAKLNATVHKINRGKHVLLDPDVARLHHFKMPAAGELDIPFTVDDPISVPPTA
jgi:Glycosyltransferase family 92